jgi:hypothetical protein
MEIKRIKFFIELPLALAVLYVYSGQLEIMKGQLGQMEGSSQQTERQLAIAARNATTVASAADTAKKQLNLVVQQMQQAEKQVSARLVIQNVKIDYSPDFYSGKAKVTFDVTNVGNSAATQIAEYGNIGASSPGRTREENFSETSQMREVDPGGFPLDKGQSKPIEMDATGWIEVRNRRGGAEWYGWKRFTYLNVYGKTDSVCILVVSSKGGLSRPLCLPVSPQR